MKIDSKKLAIGMILKHGADDALRIAKQSLESAKKSDNRENVNFYENVIININALESAKNKGDK
jgi:hypothetical protein